jgi:NADPH-dependent 2,4-dienoyl-CoA reductase/sulfur reductase-like enzyme
MKQLLIIGGSDAGISAALRAREVDPSWNVRVVVADRFPNYSICGLPFYLSGETPRWESLAHRTRAEIESHGIELLLETTAQRIDPGAHKVHVRKAAGREHELTYDRLIIATGAVPARPPTLGLEMPSVYVLHTMADSFAVHEHLANLEPKSAIIVGAGYIGLEMADALCRRGLAVTVFGVGKTVLQTVDSDFGRRVQTELERHDVEIRTGAPIGAIEREGAELTVVSAGLRRATADLVLVATGVRPSVDLARNSGLATGERGALRVSRAMESSVEDIYAAGDCVETHHRLFDAPTYLPLGTTAHKQGRVAGENAVGGKARFEGSLGTQVVKVFDLVVGRTGLRDDEARRYGFDPRTFETKTWDHKAYYPDATELHVRVTGDRRTGRLLGAQVLGAYGAEVSKRLDVFATALFHGMNVDAVEHLDLSYTPPLSSPWDPVQTSCMEWVRADNTLGGVP